MGFFLILIALEVMFVLFPFGFFWGVVRAKHYRNLNKRAKLMAEVIDIFCGILYAPMLNDLLLKDKKHLFGDSACRTISEDLGVCTMLGTLSTRGEWLVQRLHYLDPWHVEKALGLTVPEVHLTFWQQASRFAVVLTLFALMACLLAGLSVGTYYIFTITL